MTARDTSIFLPETANGRTRELIIAIIEARADPAKCVEFFHEDAVFHVLGRICDYSVSGLFRGREQILGHFRRIDSEVECSERKIFESRRRGRQGRRSPQRRRPPSRHRRRLATDFRGFRDFSGFEKIAEVFEYADTAWLKRLSGDED